MKVTKANMATVMGNVNRFFRKNVKEYLGELNQEVGSKVIDFQGEKILAPVYEKRPTYEPFIGECHVHPMRQRYLEKIKNHERVFPHEEQDAQRVLLAIHDKYSAYVIPIHEGFDISIKGNRMVIRENNVVVKSEFMGKVSYLRMKERSTYRIFVQDEITPEEMDKHIRNGLMQTYDVHDQMFDCLDLLDHFGRDEYWTVSRAHQDIWHAFYDAVQSMDINEDNVVLTLHDCLSEDIFVHLNMKKLREKASGSDDDFYFMYNGEKHGDVFGILDEEFYKPHEEEDCDYEDDCWEGFGDWD